ncbi:hypothetical protein K437DRAFT_291305 [Tilletiaria anomala UBC 951]|uniref:RING-type domain-containing protein n=1 Tax=Tilletiaria anomala (strain ATCC 24038 / CBS 436.72 / UBC 951) TaxID=1037660 RepID=A0A066VT37_TILAU|nr:uncharacterized protein K437DRAFT_291305 [Tilletiaria anomala UBC 951]KDN41974.1 hypothetical protein K437DRAFT_291305 [Tilletiaria anomala UBC 951]
MPRHSKNSTASGQFTYHERQQAAKIWGSSTARLSAFSQRAFDACTLCLSTARDAVCCSQGHLFCKECAYADLLAQKEEIERQRQAIALLARQEEAERARARQEARDRVIRDFERSSIGLGTNSETSNRTEGSTGTSKRKASDTSPSHGGDLSGIAARAEIAAKEAEERALEKLLDEQAAARKHRKLPSFWLPELTPSERQDAFALGIYGKGWAATKGGSAPLDMKPVCKAAGERGHTLTMKQLVPVHFQRPSSDIPSAGGAAADSEASSITSTAASATSAGALGGGAICPTCKACFTQATTIYILRRCGHALCQACIDTLVLAPLKLNTASLSVSNPVVGGKPSAKEKDENAGRKGQCAECDTKVNVPKDIVKLQTEGTGFAAGGNVLISKKGIAFQG